MNESSVYRVLAIATLDFYIERETNTAAIKAYICILPLKTSPEQTIHFPNAKIQIPFASGMLPM